MDLACLMRPRKLCLCKGVSKQDIEEAVAAGADNFRQLIAKTHATTGCGTCYRDVYAAFVEAREQKSCHLTGQISIKFP